MISLNLSKRLSSLQRPMLWTTLGLTIICSSMAYAVTKPSEEALMTLLKPYYPLYNETLQCHGVILKTSTSLHGKEYDNGYCVTIDRQVLVNTADGERLYVMVTGDLEFDGNGEKTLKGHAVAGLAGMFVLKPNDTIKDGWQVETADSEIMAGSWGYGLLDWKLVQLAPNKWGFVNTNGDGNQGYFESSLMILIPQNQRIEENFVPSWFNDVGTGLCDGVGQPVCEDIHAKLYQVDKTKVVDGFYPLKVKVTGNKDGKYYKDTVYTLYYKKGIGYQVPKDYPID